MITQFPYCESLAVMRVVLMSAVWLLYNDFHYYCSLLSSHCALTAHTNWLALVSIGNGAAPHGTLASICPCQKIASGKQSQTVQKIKVCPISAPSAYLILLCFCVCVSPQSYDLYQFLKYSRSCFLLFSTNL